MRKNNEIQTKGPASSRLNVILDKILKFNELGILIALFVLSATIGIINPSFFGGTNLMNILRTMSYTVIAAIGGMMIIIIGGLDLSAGSVIGLGGLIAAVCMKDLGIPVALSIILALAAGGLIGVLNAIFTVKFKIPPLIVTLGTLYIARGIVNIITQGRPVYPLPKSFDFIGNSEILSIPFSVILMLVLVVIVQFILKKTTFGRHIYAVGGNEETARLSGINIARLKSVVYIIGGVLAALTGIIMTSRMNSAQTNLGTGWELTIIASVIIGGTSTFGGSGTILGSIIGAAIMSVLSNGMVLMRISPYWQNIIIGAIIILAVGIDMYKRRKTGDIV